MKDNLWITPTFKEGQERQLNFLSLKCNMIVLLSDDGGTAVYWY